MLANALSSKFTDISGTLGSSDTILGRELRGHSFSINQSVYSVSGSAEQSFGRITDRHQQGGEKITLFSALTNSIFLPRFCKMDMIRFAGSSSCFGFSLAFWFHMFLVQSDCFSSVFFPCQSFFFNFSLLFTAVISSKLFPFFPCPPTFQYLYHPLFLSLSSAMFQKASLSFEY